MKYYLHDSNSFSDEKITELYIKFGYEGLGLFYTFLEKIALQEKPIKTSVLKSQLKVGKKLEKCWSFMESLELISSNNGESFNEQLLNFSGKYAIKKEKNREKVRQWREKQTYTDNVTSYETECNDSKLNKSKVKESKVNNIEFNFKNSLIDYGFRQELVDQWLLVRKNKKATNTETAFKIFIKEIEKKSCDLNEILELIISRSWSGFKWEWVNENKKNNYDNKISGEELFRQSMQLAADNLRDNG
jgi:hypothetical protein